MATRAASEKRVEKTAKFPQYGTLLSVPEPPKEKGQDGLKVLPKSEESLGHPVGDIAVAMIVLLFAPVRWSMRPAV